jgi:phosphatidylglycerol lysyltransferase
VLDALAAFSRRGLLRYGVEALLRGPAIVVRVLALLLIPWTLVMALAGGPRWFPSPLVEWSWILLDVALCGALLVLSARWRSWLATTLLVVIALDAVTTLAEVACCAVPRIDGVLAASVVFASVGAPALATVVLFNARRRAARAGLG